jgi:hypothetical protein
MVLNGNANNNEKVTEKLPFFMTIHHGVGYRV